MGRFVGNKGTDPLPNNLAHENRMGMANKSSRDNVRNLTAKLKNLKQHQGEIIKLESVKAVICALDDDDDKSIPLRNSEGKSEANFRENAVSTSDTAIRENKPTRQVGSDIGVVSKSSSCKFQKYHSDSDSGTSDFVSSSKIPIHKVNSTKKSFETLAHSFESVYKNVAKKYFIMLKPRKPSKSNFFGVFFSILAFIFYFELHTITGFSRLWLKWENVELRSVECTIESPNLAMEVFRPPVSCDICHNINSVDRVNEISPLEFERLYAYTGRPVIITDAMSNWTAQDAFSFEFFQDIYTEGSRSLEHLGEDCLFFPYVTEFRSLAEVFNMSKERSKRRWYIGWSNCDAETSHILRQHYQRPYFLPETAESTHADWIFMGTPGRGAHMHIDHVINPSWQGQIKGFKRWHLQPPPECFYECQSFHVDVHPGDIIVLDTNKWYHQTEILPGENSITIGSEYD
ncbi:unnamed protein product [Orchesella dallaii]|uniref:Cupin-like domain-containing protein n=1 Tax=Orchesella dallaii TaxID=48710 RepID=A0ABP1PLT2_9HEXA